jgi:CRISPR/Cas system CSM-associated protein Csm3 (group 7 of RAMP superfamily)
MKINYQIKMLSDWHVGSGLDSGADADALVLKDDNNLPYIPGKTVKGLLKDSLNEICEIEKGMKTKVDEVFGFAEKNDASTAGNAFFSNAELSETEKKEIAKELSSHLYKNIASTKIGENGVAVKNSLRTMQVCIPLSLEGSIETEVENAEEILEKAMKWTRYLGINRNRGLGRCKFSLTEKS